MGLLEGKKAVIFGVANDRSIAWAISEAFHAEGAELAFTYAGEVLEKRVRPLAEGIGAKIILPCDVTKDEERSGDRWTF
jgi:enoyl-[acyl-carrier protein] reductase I